MIAIMGKGTDKWETVAIGDLVEPVKRWTPSNCCSNHDFNYVDLSSIDQDLKLITGARTVSCSQAPSRARQLVESGDVLVSTVRPNLNGVARVPDKLDGATASTGFCVLRSRQSKLDGSYLFHWVKSPAFVSDMVKKATGASYPAVSDRIILDSCIALPSLAEQRRIAAILDKADDIRRRRREAMGLNDDFLRSLFLELFGDPVTNPKGWRRVALSDLLSNIDSGWSPPCLNRAAQGEEWGVLKLGAVTRCEYNPAENKALPPHVRPDPSIEVKPGDLLFSRKNTYDLVAASALVWETPPRLMMSDLIFRLRLRPDAQVDSCFLHHLLICRSKRREIQSLASGAAASMPNISKARLASSLVELPPLELQRQFARQVALARKLNTSQLTASSEAESLFTSLQQRAFTGDL